MGKVKKTLCIIGAPGKSAISRYLNGENNTTNKNFSDSEDEDEDEIDIRKQQYFDPQYITIDRILDKEQVEEEESEYEVDPEEEKEKLNLIQENRTTEEIIDGEEKDEKQNDQINIKGGKENTGTKNEKELTVHKNDIDDEN